MKYRAILIAAVGIALVAPGVCAAFPASPGAPPSVNKPFEGEPDINKNTWQPWQAPAATVNPESLIPSDDTSNGLAGAVPLATFHTNSAQLGKLFHQGDAAKREGAKPIELVEASIASPMPDGPSPAAAPAPKSHGTKRVLTIALVCVALLAFRKFRQITAGPAERKPSFL